MGNCGGRERDNEPPQTPIIRNMEIVRGVEEGWAPHNAGARILPIDIRQKSQKGKEISYPKKPGL